MALLTLTDTNGDPYYVNTDNIIGFGTDGGTGTMFSIVPGDIQVQESPATVAGMWPSGS